MNTYEKGSLTSKRCRIVRIKNFESRMMLSGVEQSDLSAAAEVVINLPESDRIDVELDGNSLVVRSELAELFRAPASNIARLDLQGTAQPDTVNLSNLDSVFQGNIHLDLKDGTDRLNFVGMDHRIDFAEEAQISVSGLEWIDIRGHGANHLTFSEGDIAALSISENPLTVMLEGDDTLEILNSDFEIVGTVVEDGQFFVMAESLAGTPLRIGGLGWANPLDRLDVDNSNTFESYDLLLLFNELNRRTREDPGNSQLGNPTELQHSFALRFYDTSADGLLTPYDALLAVNGLNRQTRMDRIAAAPQAPQNGQPESSILPSFTHAPTTTTPPTSPLDSSASTSQTSLASNEVKTTGVGPDVWSTNSTDDELEPYQLHQRLDDSLLTLLAHDRPL
ncbi:hypothetical protein [Roseimaritima ulvae]|uniref:Dockerin type I repeat protein n=1 Tax=Roseimaritima ulvae TaxID=980254 RepID=A0A5B9QMJ2_9BACT|nr:hypothetical protein [Roseimaritima ulvae]QEG38236.1 hypothetical protein UC8_01910 [Roseimaritima ulvae]